MALFASSPGAWMCKVQLEDTTEVAGVELKINGAGVRSAGAGRAEVYGGPLPARSQSAEKIPCPPGNPSGCCWCSIAI